MFRPIFAQTFINLKKYFFSLLLISVVLALANALPNHFLKGSGYLIPIAILQMLFNICGLIATYEILSDRPFSLSTQVNILTQKFPRWFLGLIVTWLVTARAFFPMIFPGFLKLIQLLFVFPILLFENDNKINALEKSKAILGGREKSFLGIYVATFIFLIIITISMDLNILNPELGLPLEIIAATIATLFWNVFFITFYKTRSSIALCERNIEVVSYGKIIKESLLGGIGGFLWTIFICGIVAVVGVAIYKMI